MWEKIKLFRTYLDRKDVFTILLIISISSVSFLLGKLSALDQKKIPVTVEAVLSEQVVSNSASVFVAGEADVKKATPTNTVKTKEVINTKQPSLSQQNYVASKTGTKYHLPSCASAKKISEKNKIWFATKEEAEQAGFSPASNCKGL